MKGAGLVGLGYAFPAVRRTVRELETAGQLSTPAATLEAFGFQHVHVATQESEYELALAAARAALDDAGADPCSVDLLLYGGSSTAVAFQSNDARGCAGDGSGTLDRFKFPVTRLQYDLGLTNAAAFGVGQMACATLFAAVRIARALCASEGLRRVLCVSAEFFPAHAGREAIFNCTSDAACAVLVDGAAERCRVAAVTQVTKGYYWDCDERRAEIVASYFPTSKHVIQKSIADAGWTAADVDWVIPHNVSARSWQILMGLVQLPNARIWSQNIARDGHTLAGDNFINLKDALDSGAVRPGEKLLLFSYGFGAHWTAIALEA